MSEDNSTTAKFNLDAREAIASANELRKKISEISETSLSGLVGSITHLAGPMVALAIEAWAFKKGLELTVEAEGIRQIERSFETLTKQVGISSEALKHGMEASVGKLMTVSEAMEHANKAIVELGSRASEIPKIFDLAKKSAKVFGGDVGERFDQITRAIETGNVRLLKQAGLYFDVDKALGKYADSLGLMKSSLSEGQKQQAMLNGVLETGQKKLGGIKIPVDTASLALKEMATASKELVESIALAVEKTGYFKSFFNGLKIAAEATSDVIKSRFGTELEKVTINITKLTESYNEQLLAINDPSMMDKVFGGSKEVLQKHLLYLKGEIEKSMAYKDQLMAKEKSENGHKEEEDKKEVGPSTEELEKARAEKFKFETDMLTLRKSRIAAELTVETDAVTYYTSLNEQRETIAREFDLKKEQLDIEASKHELANRGAINDRLYELEAEKNARLLQFDNERSERMVTLYQNQANAQKTLTSGFKAAAAQAVVDGKNMQKVGDVAFKSLTSHTVAYFKALGEGKNGGEAFKQMMFGVLGDIAMKKGEVMLAEGLGKMFLGEPGGAGAAGEGAALIALGGALGAAASSGSSSNEAGAGPDSKNGPSYASQEGPTLTEQKKKTVTISVAGNYFETEQTKKRLMEMIREETDATDFKYQQIGIS
jgi:hypothetical protein